MRTNLNAGGFQWHSFNSIYLEHFRSNHKLHIKILAWPPLVIFLRTYNNQKVFRNFHIK